MVNHTVENNLDVQRELAGIWTQAIEESRALCARVEVTSCIQEAVHIAQNVCGVLHGDGERLVLVTGSLHLVGGVLSVLGSEVV